MPIRMNSMQFPFTIFPIIFIVMFLLFFVIFISVFVKIIGQWHKNNKSPRLAVPALIVAKRTNVSHHRHGSRGMHHSSTTYYVTF